MRLEVDWTRCEGHGLCARWLPEHVSLDEWGFPTLDHPEVTARTLRDARRATASCPVLALRLEQR